MIELSETASNAMLETLSELMDGGSIELLAESESVLAVLQLSTPAAMPASNGELVFNAITEEDAALAQGEAASARVLTADGNEVFSCDVGDLNSDAEIKLNSTRIYPGSPVRLKSFRLAMP
jgi:hypothetical protein